MSEEEMLAEQAIHPRANWGLLLGPVSNTTDIECDSPEATETYRKLFPDVRTPAWASKRGSHHLHEYDPRLADLPGVVKYQGLEFRLGNGKATQSIIPPSVVDGVKREWTLSPKDCPPAKLPEAVIQILLTLPPAAKGNPRKSTEIPAARKAKVEKLLRWCRRSGLTVVATREDHHGLVFIDLDHCPFKPQGSERGAPALIVFADGGHCFKCFHPDCHEKGFADLEKAFGPLFPTIRCGTDLHRVVSQSLQALQDDTDVMQRGVLGEIAYDAPKPKLCLHANGAPQFHPIGNASMTVKLSAVAKYEKFDKREGEWVPAFPPDKVVQAILEGPRYQGIPVLTGIYSCPVLRADGSIARQPGLDSQTGLYLDISGSFPDLMEADKALEEIGEVLHDFPFATAEHRAAAIAAICTLPCHPAFAGPAPFLLVDANASRIGKGLHTDVYTVVWEGREAARHTVPESGDGEMRKLITSTALGGSQYLLFDNIKGKFGGATIENAMTAARWSDRLLGINRKVDLPLNIIWLGTSNNAVLTGDMVNRTLHIRLETECERPDERSGFRHPDLLAYVREHRRELVVAALSIPAKYIEAGRPDMQLPPWGGYQGWSDLIRNAIVWAGLPDPKETREQLADQADEEGASLRELIDAWKELGSATVAEAIIKADTGEAPLLAALMSDMKQGDRRRTLGTMLRCFRGRVLDGWKLERTRSTQPKWHILPTAKA
jgi:hypothetical protein